MDSSVTSVDKDVSEINLHTVEDCVSHQDVDRMKTEETCENREKPSYTDNTQRSSSDTDLYDFIEMNRPRSPDLTEHCSGESRKLLSFDDDEVQLDKRPMSPWEEVSDQSKTFTTPKLSVFSGTPTEISDDNESSRDRPFSPWTEENIQNIPAHSLEDTLVDTNPTEAHLQTNISFGKEGEYLLVQAGENIPLGVCEEEAKADNYIPGPDCQPNDVPTEASPVDNLYWSPTGSSFSTSIEHDYTEVGTAVGQTNMGMSVTTDDEEQRIGTIAEKKEPLSEDHDHIQTHSFFNNESTFNVSTTPKYSAPPNTPLTLPTTYHIQVPNVSKDTRMPGDIRTYEPLSEDHDHIQTHNNESTFNASTTPKFSAPPNTPLALPTTYHIQVPNVSKDTRMPGDIRTYEPLSEDHDHIQTHNNESTFNASTTPKFSAPPNTPLTLPTTYHIQVPNVSKDTRTRADIRTYEPDTLITPYQNQSILEKTVATHDAKPLFDKMHLIRIGSFSILGGVVASLYSQFSCRFAVSSMSVGANGSEFNAYAGLWKYHSITNMFSDYASCSPYDGAFFISAPYASRNFGVVAFVAGFSSLFILWRFLFFSKTTLVLWRIGFKLAVVAGVSQILTLLFFTEGFCLQNKCTMGSGSVLSIIAAISWFVTAYFMHRNPPIRQTVMPNEDRSLVRKILDLTEISLILEYFGQNSASNSTQKSAHDERSSKYVVMV